MPLRLVAVTFDAGDAGRLARFWAGLLDREVVDEPGGALVPGDGTQVGLRFAPSTATKAGSNRMHLHLASSDLADPDGNGFRVS